MSNFVIKRFPLYRLILVALCLCLSFSSIANALVMAPHDMAPANAADHAAQLGQSHIENHVEHHKSVQHMDTHDSCDDGEGRCSTTSTCATHCAASFAQSAPSLCPVVIISGLETEAVITSPLPINLGGPFKPPRLALLHLL